MGRNFSCKTCDKLERSDWFRGKSNLKIARSEKTPFYKYNQVARSLSCAPDVN